MFRRICCVAAIVLLAGLWQIAYAAPDAIPGIAGPGKVTGTITVYIPRDPEAGRTRHDDVKTGIEKWKAAAAAEGATINVEVLNADGTNSAGKTPKAGDSGSVMVNWNSSMDAGLGGTFQGTYNGEPTGKTDSKGNPIIKNATLDSGVINLPSGATALPGQDSMKARDAAMHEAGHMLGIGHSNHSDSVMQPTLESYLGKSPSAGDKAELKATCSAGPANIIGTATFLIPNQYRYDYTVNWGGGGSGAGDVALISLVTGGAMISGIQAPNGWETVAYPNTFKPDILSFRVLATDTLQAYLNAGNPTVSFSFISAGAPMTSIGWAGIYQDVIVPVPEPSSLLALGTGAIGLFGILRRRRK